MSFKRTLSIAGLSLSLAGFANAEVESSLSISHESNYLFRGVDLGEDSFNAGYNYSTSAAGLDWELGLGSRNSDLGNETTASVLASASLGGNAGLHVGLQHRKFEDGTGILGFDGNLSEVTVGLSADFGGITLAGTVFFNIAESDGNEYYELSAGKSVSLGDGISADFDVTYGDWGVAEFLTVSAGLNKSLSDDVTAGVTYTYVDSDLTVEDQVIGLSLSVDL